MKKALIFVLVSFSSIAQNAHPIPMWISIVPDTILISTNYDTIVLAQLCQNHVVEDYSYKGYNLYQLKKNEFYSFDVWRLFSPNSLGCMDVNIPKDSIQKYHLTNIAIQDSNLNAFSIKYSLLSKAKKMREKGALFDFEYKIKVEIYFNDREFMVDTLQYGSNIKKWKSIKPVKIYRWNILDSSKGIIMINFYNYYLKNLDNEKVNYRERVYRLFDVEFT